jgi:nicotinamide-nucleotide amidase
MKAEIISVGDEILLGMIVDTNATYLCDTLASHGIAVVRQTAVGDDPDAIGDAIATASQRGELVVVNGGIGPTADDVTRQAVAEVAGGALRMDDQWLSIMKAKFEHRNIEMPASNQVQALIPENAARIFNPVGTAAGFFVRINAAEVAVFPGVPAELKAMFEQEYLPGLLERAATGEVIITRRLKCFGMPESLVNERITDLMGPNRNPLVGLLASGAIISVKITARAKDQHTALNMIDEVKARARERLGDYVFGEDDEDLQAAVGRLLTNRGFTVCTAESCTGGLISKRLTDLPGSSKYFLGGVVAYSNEAKIDFLGVPERCFREVGAVSREVAAAMAEGIRERMGADYGLSATGIAGPTGGTKEKPVGLVYIGLSCPPDPASPAGPPRTEVTQLRLSGSRDAIRDRAAKHALNILRLRVMREAPAF